MAQSSAYNVVRMWKKSSVVAGEEEEEKKKISASENLHGSLRRLGRLTELQKR
jgi:hypothetical protein